MNYEIAKQLKDAGFPKSEGWFETLYYCNSDSYCNNTSMDSEITKSPCESCGWFGWRSMNKEPRVTLSELIEACGDRFYGVIRDFFDKGWTAGEYWDYDFFGGEIAYGNTPEEAVANLYIQLNKK